MMNYWETVRAADQVTMKARRTGATCGLLAIILLATLPAWAQDDDPLIHVVPPESTLAQLTQAPLPSAQDQDRQATTDQNQNITLPPGTRLSLALVRSISFKHSRRGDRVNLQVVFPVISGNTMVIPPGTYVQGVLDEITRSDRRYEVLAMRLRSADMAFSTGYTVSISGPLDLNPTYGKLAPPDSPVNGQVPVMAATGPPTLPPLPPLPQIGPSPGKVIGITFGALAAGTIVAVILYHNRDFLMEAGTPVEIDLSEPLVLDQSSVTAALQQFSQAPPQIVDAPRRMRTCWTPATPDYPSTPYPCPW